MGMLDDFRSRYPEYRDVPDKDLSDSLYKKHYASRMSRDEFDRKVSPNVVADVAKSVGSGLVTGTEMLAGAAGDAREGMDFLGKWIGDRIAGGREAREAKDAKYQEWLSSSPMRHLPGIQNALEFAPTTRQVADTQRSVTGFQPHDPQTTLGQYANTAAEFVPGAVALGPGRAAQQMGANAVKFGVVPGLTSEAAGQTAQAFLPQAEGAARIAGAFAGPMVAGGLRKAVTPTRSDPHAQAAARVLEAEGVETTAGQRTGSNALRYAEEEIGGSQAAAFFERQGEQFTRAALRRAGITADRATPDVLDQAFTTLGNEFDRLAASTTARIDSRTTRDVRAALRDYMLLTPESARVPAVQRFADAIMAAPGGQLTGQQYQYIRSVMGAQARQLAGNGAQGYQGASALRSFQDALDNAVERSMRDPALMRQWREVRQHYRNILPIEEAMARAGKDTAQGLISPRALRSAVSKRKDRRNYVRGRGDYSELARAAEAVMKPMPQSGTAPRLAARGVVDQAPTAIGGALGLGAGGGNLFGAFAGMAFGRASQAAANAATRGAMFDPRGRAYLANQLLPPSDLPLRTAIPPAAYGGLISARGER